MPDTFRYNKLYFHSQSPIGAFDFGMLSSFVSSKGTATKEKKKLLCNIQHCANILYSNPSLSAIQVLL